LQFCFKGDLMKLNKKLKQYIEMEILPRYQSNDKGHGIEHINYVINRSIKFARTLEDINMNMVYTIACYHDLGHSIDAKRHEEISAQILLKDDNLKSFFIDDEILIMSEAIFDHRASLEYEPRSIYGKIISSAAQNTGIEDIFKRTYEYCIVHMPESSLGEIIDASYEHR